jgi:CRP-like cAMP-binding protein/Fe-S-cluster-containing hydrogenase component 2
MALHAGIFEFELLAHFTDAQRETLRRGIAEDPSARVLHFEPGEKICSKGEFELDLCLILKGAVDLLDETANGWARVATMRAGEFYGELGAIGGLPRSTDVVAAEPTDIFYLPRHALKFLEINPDARRILSDRYRERAVRVVSREIDLFRQAPPGFIDDLIPHCEIERYDLSGVTIVKQGEPGDAFYIVRDGFVKVVRELDDGDGGSRVLAYLHSGEYFGEMALLGSDVRYASVLTAGRCELIRIRGEDFLRLCALRPEVEDLVRDVIARRREQETRITPEISELLERSGQLGVIQADAPLVMDLDLCVKCDNCVKACETLHGHSRLIRNGIHLDKYLVPSACRHCDDPKCMNSCPTGAIERRPGGEIYFQYEMCIGCGNCAIACPYDNIAMIDTPTFDQAQARKARITGERDFFRPYPLAAHDAPPSLWRSLFGPAKPAPADEPSPDATRAHVPPAFPIKCDLCDGLPFMGCVHNCPTGAAIRLDPAQLFASTGAIRPGSRVQKARSADGAATADSRAPMMESARPRAGFTAARSIPLVAIASLVVIIAHAASAGVARSLGPYRTGIATLTMFAAASLYSLRKRSLWSSLQALRLTEIFPAPIRRWMVAMDRLEIWRRFHLLVGVLAMLPLWWHMRTGRMNMAEALLASAVVLLLLSGILGVIIQDLLPYRARAGGDYFVRLQDVDAAINALYVDAEEKILGRSENLIQSYIRLIRPILMRPQPGLRMFRAMLTGSDPAAPALEPARAQAAKVGDELALFNELIAIAVRKIRLDLNEFDLWFSTAWLRVHIALAMLVGALAAFHVLGVLYFVGA